MIEVNFATLCLSSTPLFSEGKPERLSELTRVCCRHSSVRCVRAAAYVTNATWGGAPTRQTGSNTSSPEMRSALDLTLIHELLWGQTTLVQNRKRRRERRWRGFLRHFLGGWHCVTCTSRSALRKCGFQLPACHHRDLQQAIWLLLVFSKRPCIKLD